MTTLELQNKLQGIGRESFMQLIQEIGKPPTQMVETNKIWNQSGVSIAEVQQAIKDEACQRLMVIYMNPEYKDASQ